MTRLNRFPADSLSEQEQAVRHVFNAYCQLFKGSVKTARQHLDEVEHLREKLIPGIMQHFLIAEAMYWERIGEYEKSLTTYDAFLHTDYAEINSSLYKEVLQDKADLLVKMGRKEEAYKQYGLVFSYIKSSFEKNYPKEIDQLTTRFQADRLTYQNERDRLFSYRFYLGGIIVCTLVLFLFLYLSWKKIFRLQESKHSQEVMIRKAERAIQKKNMFLSNMSHEVRTPLNAIVGFSDMLANEPEFSNEERQEFVDIINTNTKLLLKLVGDVLELSRIESGNLSFTFQRESVCRLLDDVYQTHSLLIRPPLQFLKDFPPEDVQVNVDPMRLTQVLTNFLNNANKFTKGGSIRLGYCCPSGMSEVHLYVEDTGIGIPHSEQKMIFERFYKRSEFSQGVGLGLSICVLIVEKMGGRIELRSEEGRGSRFTVVLPCIE